MPLYTAITQGSLPDEAKARIAEELTRIHSTVMKVPKSFVHVIFLSYPKGSGFTAGKEGPAASLNCVLRSGHTAEEKTDLLKQLWSAFQNFSGVGDGSTRDFPSRDSRQQRDGNGAIHAGRQQRLGKHFLQHEQVRQIEFCDAENREEYKRR